MAGKRKRKVVRRRNPLVPAVRKLGHKVRPSARRYRRRPKHPQHAASDPPEAGAEDSRRETRSRRLDGPA